jgi:hypothetical protein
MSVYWYPGYALLLFHCIVHYERHLSYTANANVSQMHYVKSFGGASQKASERDIDLSLLLANCYGKWYSDQKVVVNERSTYRKRYMSTTNVELSCTWMQRRLGERVLIGVRFKDLLARVQACQQRVDVD